MIGRRNSIRIDPGLLARCDEYFGECGTTTEARVNAYLRDVLSNHGDDDIVDSGDEFYERVMEIAPRAGRKDRDGMLILPSDWDDPRDDVYDDYRRPQMGRLDGQCEVRSGTRRFRKKRDEWQEKGQTPSRGHLG